MDINTVIEARAIYMAWCALHYHKRDAYKMRMERQAWADCWTEEQREAFLTQARGISVDKARLLRLAAKFLEVGAEEYGNHGCNDMDLTDLGLTRAEQEELIRLSELGRHPEDRDEEGAIHRLPYCTDFGMMYTVAGMLEEMANDDI